MTWEIARGLIEKNILKGTDINTERSTLRAVLETSHPCWKYDYNGESGFLISIGNSASNNIEIPWSMLESAFDALSSTNGYGREWFSKAYPKQCNDHGCHIHAIGRILEIAGVACRVDKVYLPKS